MSEKIIQLQLSPGDGEETTDILYALTDQGRVFIGEWHPHPDDDDEFEDGSVADEQLPVFKWDSIVLPALPQVTVDE